MDRLLVILDLDETLVHVANHPLPRQADFTVNGHTGYRRPHLASFLDALHPRYDVAVWTAAGRDYAHAIVSEIIPWHAELAFFWCAERCTQHFDHETRNRSTIKKLRKVEARGYDLGRVVMVDDSPEKHLRNYGNLIAVKPFLGEHEDTELLAVADYIHSLEHHPNIRAVEKRHWREGKRLA